MNNTNRLFRAALEFVAAQAQRIGEGLIHGPAARRLVGDLVEDVGQVVDGVDDLADVGLLERLNAGVEREDLVIDDRGDPDLIDVVGCLERMAHDVVGRGAEVEGPAVEEHHGELIGTIQVNGPTSGPRGIHIAGPLSAQIIDELPVLAAIAPYTINGISIRDARELRVKESDRITLVAKNLKGMGAHFTEHEDGLEIPGSQHLHGAQIDSGSDHRSAMAFAIAALRAEGDTEIHGAEAAAISFPEFFTHLDQLCQR